MCSWYQSGGPYSSLFRTMGRKGHKGQYCTLTPSSHLNASPLPSLRCLSIYHSQVPTHQHTLPPSYMSVGTSVDDTWRANKISRHPAATWTHLDRPWGSPWALPFSWSSSSAWVASSLAATTGTSFAHSINLSPINTRQTPPLNPHPPTLSSIPRYIYKFTFTYKLKYILIHNLTRINIYLVNNLYLTSL